MLVVVDMGNTNITMGLYKEDTLIKSYYCFDLLISNIGD